MTDPAPLREAIARTIQQHDNDHIPENYASGLSDEVSDWSAYLADKVLAALPTDAVQPVGGHKVTWVNDASNVNDRRMYVDGQQWAKVYGWDEVSLNARCDALAAAMERPLYATAPTAGSGWLPIESAPKDGTRILATGGGLGDAVEIVDYYAAVGCWNTPESTLDDRDDESEGYSRPTHWMPLPAAPQVGSE